MPHIASGDEYLIIFDSNSVLTSLNTFLFILKCRLKLYSAIISIINQKEENITRYICDDSSRVKCRYKNLEGEIVKDVKGKKLWDACKEPVKERVKEIRKDLSTKLPMCSDKWSECAQPVLGADILPPPGFSTFLSTVV